MFKGKNGIIFTWASWSYDSENIMHRINMLIQQSNANYVALGINVDASKKSCKENVERNSIDIPIVCDEQLFDSKLMAKLGLHAVPENIIIDPTGKVVARNVALDDLERYIK